MDEKTWREKAFLFGMLSPVVYFIFMHVAMLFYAGGTMLNPNAPGYSYWANFYTDLGRACGYSVGEW